MPDVAATKGFLLLGRAGDLTRLVCRGGSCSRSVEMARAILAA